MLVLTCLPVRPVCGGNLETIRRFHVTDRAEGVSQFIVSDPEFSRRPHGLPEPTS